MKTSTTIKGSVLLIGLALVVGYYLFNLSLRNNIQLENAGSVTWNKIELKAGGRIFKIDHLDAGAKKKFLFHSRSEGGGIITGYIGPNFYKSEFGYFTPNLSEDTAILLNDDGSIDIKENF
jgi:hypothetical protein